MSLVAPFLIPDRLHERRHGAALGDGLRQARECRLGVGPFAGPRTLLTSLPDRHSVPLAELLAHLNLAHGPHDYVAEIRYRQNVRKPRRGRGVSDSDYATAMAAYEAAKADQT